LHILPQHGRVLIIVTRNAIKDMLENDVKTIPFSYSRLCGKDAESQITLATMWDIKKHFKHHRGTQKFDFVVVDEAHAILADSFADASFWLAKFIGTLPKRVKVFAMSACIDWVRDLDIFRGWEYQDYRQKCVGTRPKQILMAHKDDFEDILKTASPSNMILCFCQSAKRAYRLEKIYNSLKIPSLAITSQSEMRPKDSDFSAAEEECYRDYLVENKKFPAGILIIFTTSLMREGVEIKDRSVKTVVTELIDRVSLIQVAGRVRHGVEKLFIILTKETGHLFHGDPIEHDKTAKKRVTGRAEIIGVLKSNGIGEDNWSNELGPIDENLKGPAVEGTGRKFYHNPYWLKNELKKRRDHRAFKDSPAKYLFGIFNCLIEVHTSPKAGVVHSDRLMIDKIVADHIREHTPVCSKASDGILMEKLREVGCTEKSLGNILRNHSSFRRIQENNHHCHQIVRVDFLDDESDDQGHVA